MLRTTTSEPTVSPGSHWSFVDRAPRPDTIRPGAIVTAGDTGATATVEILTVDLDGFVTFRTLD